MSVTSRSPKTLWLALLLALSGPLFGQTNQLIPQGGEFSILGNLPGDQVWPSVSLAGGAGCIAWQDNVIGKISGIGGAGIGGAMLNSSFTAGRIFRLNRAPTANGPAPTRVKAQLLANNNTIFVFQSPAAGTPDIYARWARGAKGSESYGTNLYTLGVRVNSYTVGAQVAPAVAALPDGSAIITWASWSAGKIPGVGQDGSMFGVFARRMEPNGTGGGKKEFQVNQYTAFNQRDPAVATLANGNYVITWISEQERSSSSVDVYARVFSSDGVPQTDEIAINSGKSPCATPAVAPLNDGGFTVVWAQQDTVVSTNGLDIWGRAFSASGSPEGDDFRINTDLDSDGRSGVYGDQENPKIAAGPAGSMVVWTSLGEEPPPGTREGVYGRFLQGGTQPVGNEFRVNTTTISQQMHPDVAWDGVGRFLVVWTSFNGATSGFDLYGQTYVVTAQ